MTEHDIISDGFNVVTTNEARDLLLQGYGIEIECLTACHRRFRTSGKTGRKVADQNWYGEWAATVVSPDRKIRKRIVSPGYSRRPTMQAKTFGTVNALVAFTELLCVDHADIPKKVGGKSRLLFLPEDFAGYE